MFSMLFSFICLKMAIFDVLFSMFSLWKSQNPLTVVVRLSLERRHDYRERSVGGLVTTARAMLDYFIGQDFITYGRETKVLDAVVSPILVDVEHLLAGKQFSS